MELRPGHRIDRYELVAPLARGGMGAVWLARVQRMPGFEKFFAVKTVLPQYAADPAFRKMFIDEARIACAINHPNVAAIIDVGEEAGMLFTVMEWVDGDSLDALKRTVEAEGGRIPHGIVLRLMSDACGGLHAAHEARDRSGKLLEIVHRDISPHNILIDPQGAAMLIDFGIALARDRVAETTSSGLKGKVRYMSPEQAEGGTDIDRRADVWAVGAVMYRLIEGHAPYEGASELSVLRSLFTESSPDPMRANLPAPLAAVIMKCLSRDRSARYESAGELQRALEIAMRDANVMTTSADVAAYAKTRLAKRVSTRRAKIGAILSQLDNRAIPPREPPPREPSLGDPPPRREPCSSTAITLSDAAAPPPAEAEIIPTIDSIDMNLGADGTLGAGFVSHRGPTPSDAAGRVLVGDPGDARSPRGRSGRRAPRVAGRARERRDGTSRTDAELHGAGRRRAGGGRLCARAGGGARACRPERDPVPGLAARRDGDRRAGPLFNCGRGSSGESARSEQASGRQAGGSPERR